MGNFEPGNVKSALIHFYNIHHQRYTIYWTKMTKEEYKQNELSSIDYQEKLDKIKIDLVNTNEQQPENILLKVYL